MFRASAPGVHSSPLQLRNALHRRMAYRNRARPRILRNSRLNSLMQPIHKQQGDLGPSPRPPPRSASPASCICSSPRSPASRSQLLRPSPPPSSTPSSAGSALESYFQRLGRARFASIATGSAPDSRLGGGIHSARLVRQRRRYGRPVGRRRGRAKDLEAAFDSHQLPPGQTLARQTYMGNLVNAQPIQRFGNLPIPPPLLLRPPARIRAPRFARKLLVRPQQRVQLVLCALVNLFRGLGDL